MCLTICCKIIYCIVLGKHPWALAAQAPNFEVAGYTETVLKWFNYPRTRGNYTEIVLKWFNYPCARAHPGCDVSCQRTESTCIIGSLCFVEASLTVEKAVSCYKADQLVASLLSFHTFSRCLQYVNFVLQGMNAVNEATDGCMQTFDA